MFSAVLLSVKVVRTNSTLWSCHRCYRHRSFILWRSRRCCARPCCPLPPCAARWTRWLVRSVPWRPTICIKRCPILCTELLWTDSKVQMRWNRQRGVRQWRHIDCRTRCRLPWSTSGPNLKMFLWALSTLPLSGNRLPVSYLILPLYFRQRFALIFFKCSQWLSQAEWREAMAQASWAVPYAP